ncbi:hypothetical protein BKA70DRAFT_1113501, partial [Coprinopsis sp. MPI-PUGE-AT-0042]
ERLSRTWTSSIYGFFEPTVEAVEKDGRRCHEFKCGARNCVSKGAEGRIVRRFLDRGDKSSTGNLIKHAHRCWGKELVDEAKNANATVGDIRKGLAIAQMKDGKITTSFERQGKGKITFSARQHTYHETRATCVRWVARSLRPMAIVDDEDFHCLMKTGRPHYRLPHSRTVARDVHEVFCRVKAKIAKWLQVGHD